MFTSTCDAEWDDPVNLQPVLSRLEIVDRQSCDLASPTVAGHYLVTLKGYLTEGQIDSLRPYIVIEGSNG